MLRDNWAPHDYWPGAGPNLVGLLAPPAGRFESRTARERYIAVVRAVQETPKTSIELADILGLSEGTMRSHLVRWTRQGRLERTPVSPNRVLGRPIYVYRPVRG